MARFSPTFLLATVVLVFLPAPAVSAGSAAAQATVDLRYDDPDPAASYVPLSITTTERASRRDRLRAVERALERHPDHPRLLTERGFHRYAKSHVELAEADFARAMVVTADDPLARRAVLWSQGWALFNAGRNERALAAWAESERLHGGRPYWVPYSRALAEWRLGRQQAAVATWQQAVDGVPELGTKDGLLRRTAFWPRHQIETAKQVFHAWQASRSA